MAHPPPVCTKGYSATSSRTGLHKDLSAVSVIYDVRESFVEAAVRITQMT